MDKLEIKDKVIVVNGIPVTLTADTIKATCQWYADNAQACIDEELSGTSKYPVNNQEEYIQEMTEQKEAYLTGNFMPSLSFWQKAYFIQTGKSVAMLS